MKQSCNTNRKKKYGTLLFMRELQEKDWDRKLQKQPY